MGERNLEPEIHNPKHEGKVSVSISFETVELPPFSDILILGKRCPHGKMGISRCMNLMSPDAFDLVELETDAAEVMLVNKRILKKVSKEKIIELLSETVFPYITNSEVVRVDFKTKITWKDIEL